MKKEGTRKAKAKRTAPCHKAGRQASRAQDRLPGQGWPHADLLPPPGPLGGHPESQTHCGRVTARPLLPHSTDHYF